MVVDGRETTVNNSLEHTLTPYHHFETDSFKPVKSIDELPTKGATGFHLKKLFEFCQNEKINNYNFLKSTFKISPRTFESNSESYIYAITRYEKVIYTYNGNAFNGIINHISQNMCADKYATNFILNKLGIPSNISFKITNKVDLIQFTKQLDFTKRWVLKPKNGAMGVDVFVEIQSPREMIAIGKKVLKKWHSIIIEPQITFTQDIRVQCVNGNFYAAIQRDKPHVIGDGISTIEELINEKNRIPERKNHPIIIDHIAKKILKKNNLSLGMIPEKNKKVVLRDTCNISQGAEILDVSLKVHSSIKEIANVITNYLQIPNLAFDVLTIDIERPLKDTKGVVIEINPTPQWSGMYQIKGFTFIRDLLESIFEGTTN